MLRSVVGQVVLTVTSYLVTQHNIMEDVYLQQRCCENLKCHIVELCKESTVVTLLHFRVLGKFGGGNRKMMIEPQKLEYNDKETPGPAIIAYFQEHTRPIDFPVEKVKC